MIAIRRRPSISQHPCIHPHPFLRGKHQTYDLRQVQRVVSDGVKYKVLQPVDYVEELIS